jgi:hypothetical protein
MMAIMEIKTLIISIISLIFLDSGLRQLCLQTWESESSRLCGINPDN